jgi:hypothetical protein
MIRKYSGKVIERKYTGRKWSAGIVLLLVYWLVMVGMVINAGIYYDRTQRLAELH